MLTKSPAAEKGAELAKREAEEMAELVQREERVLAKRETERVQKHAEITELAEKLKRRECELLASREMKSQAYTRARQLHDDEREAWAIGELVAREKQAAEDRFLREELRVAKERLRQSEEERRQLAEITMAEGRAEQQTDRDQVPRTPPMTSPVEARDLR